jgi:hypothetical protein
MDLRLSALCRTNTAKENRVSSSENDYGKQEEKQMTDKKIGEIFNEVLTGDTLKNALDFIDFLDKNDIIQSGQHEWDYNNKRICYIDTRSGRSSWIVWTEGDYDTEHEGFPINERMKEIAWANVMECGNCKDTECNGKAKTVFGKEFAYVCNADNVKMTFKFTNPGDETLDCVKRLVLMRKHIIGTE